MHLRITNIAVAIAIAVLFVFVGQANAATKKVCTTGCDYTPAQLQTAIDAMANGDTLLLESGHTFTGNFTMPEVACAANDATCWKTIKTGVSSTGTVLSTSLFPADHMRASPSYSGTFAKLKVLTDNQPALRTVYHDQVSWWRVQWLELEGDTYGGNGLLWSRFSLPQP